MAVDIKIKIAFLAPLDENLYLFRLPWIDQLMKHGYSVTAIVPEGDFFDKISRYGIRALKYDLKRNSINPFREIYTLIQLWMIFRREKFDIVHTFTIKPNIYGTLAARAAGVRTVVNHVTGLGYVHTERTFFVLLLRWFVSQLYRLSFRFSEKVIFQNPDDLKVLLPLLRQSKAQVIQGSGVDIHHFSPASFDHRDAQELRSSLGIRGDSVVITIIARLLKHKGIEEFISAADNLSHMFPEALFLIVGWIDKDNPTRLSFDFLQQSTRNPRIKFLGKRSDIKEILSITDIYTLPSYREGTPRTVLEAMAMGKPIVTTDAPGCRQVVENGVNGFLVPVKDAAAFQAAVERLISDRLLRERMGLASRKKVIAEFSNDVVIDQVVKLYDSLTIPAGSRAGVKRPVRLCIMTTVPISIVTFYGKQLDFLKEKGFEVTVVTSSDNTLEKEISGSCRLKLVPMTRKITPVLDMISLIRIYRIMRRSRFDIVQYSSPKAALLGSVAAWLNRVPVRLYLMWGLYYSGQTGFKRVLMKLYERIVCSLSVHVAPDSNGNRTFAIEEHLCPADKISVIGKGSANGVDLARFDRARLQTRRGQIRRRLTIPDNAVVFGFVGRLRREKGINELVRAFMILEKRYPQIHLLLIAPRESGTNEVDHEVEDFLSGSNRAISTGYQNNPEEYMAAMDIFVLPSYREGFGIVNVEASAMSLPVISTDIPGPRDSVVHNTTGLLVPVKSVDMLARSMEQLINDTGMRAGMGEAGRSWAAHFEQGRLWEKIFEHRCALLSKAGRYSYDAKAKQVFTY
jgi:N,N'-diacetylbacillosaminyl-diphospho-undecaprenol alpha-1,3-N-acetylgalactosaminyltransferase